LGFHGGAIWSSLIPAMPEPNKIVHVMRRFVPEAWGGTESVVFGLSRELNRRGIESPVYCTAMLAEPGTQTFEGVLVKRFGYLFPWFDLTPEAKARLRLKGGSPLSLPLFWGLLKEKDVAVIHTHVQHRLGGMARTAARLKGIPYIVSLHGGFFTLPQAQIDQMVEPFKGRFEWGKAFGALFGSRRVLADAAAIVCVGRSEYEAVRQRFPGKPVHYVPNAVQAERFANADGNLFRAAYGFEPEEKIVLCVSRIDFQKNQLGLVRAFSRFAKSHPDHRLVLVGAATVESYCDAVLAEIRRLGIERRTTVIEGLRPDDPLLPAAYKAAELFVLPSLHEPFGIVVLEAWAAGCPVIASRVGGVPGFATDRENILMVEPGDEAGLAGCMAELAGGADLRDLLARKAHGEVVANYDWAALGERMLGIYREAMAKG
jgi:glycosyltransferase involved in cell wall biosynthesis